jgi:integrase
VRLLRQHPPEMGFFGFSQYAELVRAAEKIDGRTLCAVLLAGDAGLRAGEITALEWSDINFAQGLVTVQRSEWSGLVDRSTRSGDPGTGGPSEPLDDDALQAPVAGGADGCDPATEQKAR